MTLETVPISVLIPDPANARRHTDRNLDAIMGSLARFGQQKPIVVDESNVVRAGNGTLAAAKALGWTEIRIVRTPLAGADATAYAIADNRTGELAKWDDEALGRLLSDPDIGNVGFDEEEMKKLLGDEPSEEPASIDESYQVVVECKDEADQQGTPPSLTASVIGRSKRSRRR